MSDQKYESVTSTEVPISHRLIRIDSKHHMKDFYLGVFIKIEYLSGLTPGPATDPGKISPDTCQYIYEKNLSVTARDRTWRLAVTDGRQYIF